MSDEEIIERGFKPWHGGEGPPVDWDRNWKVLHRGGFVGSLNTDAAYYWEHTAEADGLEIIGYRSTLTATTQ